MRKWVFFGGFMAIVVLPQLAFHTARAFGWIPATHLTWTRGSSDTEATPTLHIDARLLSARDGHFVHRAAVFGTTHDSSLVTDLRASVPDGPFANAVAAEMAIVPPASSVTVAVFHSPAAASAASAVFLAHVGDASARRGADGTFTMRRANDVVKVVVAGAALLAWSGPDSTELDAVFAASPLLTRTPSDAERTPADDSGERFWLYQPWVLTCLTIVLVCIATLWFFRMSAWAGEMLPVRDTIEVTAMSMRQRLLDVNALDVPFTVAADPSDPDRLIASWRYGDSRWIDVARAHGMRRTHRVVMRLDPDAPIVRYYDQSAAFEWSAGLDGAGLRWSSERGIVFYQQDWQRVFGLQIDAAGRLTPDLSYTRRLNLAEMKAPLVRITTQSGWRWRPTLLDGPGWLRWLTH